MKGCWNRLWSTVKQNFAELVVVSLCLAVLGGFVSAKEGFHLDEMLSFEMSNAEFNPWIVPTQPEGRLARFVHNEIDGESLGETFSNLLSEVWDVLENRGSSKLLTYKAEVYQEPVWITAEQFRDYITVDGRDAFHYLSVYFNVKDDTHPPLHYILLHTISSIFQGKAEAWMGCLINLALMAAILIFLIKTGRILAETLGIESYGRPFGLACAAFYGLSAGAVATTLLIRMYALLTLFCVLFFYLILKKWTDTGFERHNFCLILVTAMGFWTQYFFLFYCALLAAVTAAGLIRSKRIRELWGFVRSMAVAAVLGIALFPFAFSHVFSGDRGAETLGSLGEGFSGYGQRMAAFLEILKNRTFSPWFWVLVLLLTVGVFAVKRKEGKLPEQKLQGQTRAILWMLVLPTVGYFLLAARVSPFLVDRYIMAIFPFVILIGTAALFVLAARMEQKGGGWAKRSLAVLCLITLLLQVVGLAQYDGSYLYTGYDRQKTLAEEYAGYSCICVYTGVGYYENLKEFTQYEKTLLLTLEELQNRTDRESVEEQEKLAVLVKAGVDAAQVTDLLTREYGFRVEEIGLAETEPYGDTILFMTRMF